MSLVYDPPEKDALPVARVIKTTPHVEMKKYKRPDTVQNIYVDLNPTIPYDQKCREISIPIEDPHEFEFLPYAKDDQRQALFIWGMAGSGKSVTARKYLENLRYFIQNSEEKQKAYKKKTGKKFKKNDPAIYIITGNPAKDKAFDKLKNAHFLNTKPENAQKWANVTEAAFKDCIILFDDWEAMPGEYPYLFRVLLERLLQHTRKQHVYIVIITHQGMAGHRTKGIIQECDTYCLYHTNDWFTCANFLKRKLLLPEEELEEIHKLPPRHIVVRKSAPACYINEKKIKVF